MALTSRQEQRLNTRAAILQKAAEEFDVKGYVGTAISDIASGLNLTKGSVYFHFPSKAELASEIASSYFDMWGPVLDGVEERGLRGLEALTWASHQVALRYRDDVSIRAAVRLMRESSVIDADMPTPFVGWIGTVTTYLEQARQDGELRDGVSVEVAAWHIVAAFFGTQEVSHQLSGREDLEQRVEEIWHLLLPGIAARRL